MRKAQYVALALAVTAPAQAEDNLYTKIEARLAAAPALAAALGKPGPEMKSLEWMLGTWDVFANVQAGVHPPAPEHGTSVWTAALNGTWIEQRDSYPGGTQDIGYLGYGPVTKRWTSVGIDSTGNAVVIAGARAAADSFVFEGDVIIVGAHVHLRQTIARKGNDAIMLTNEERMPDGSWKLLDTYRYTRKP